MGDEDVAGEVPFTFAIPAGRIAPFVEDDEESRTSCYRAHPGPASMEVHRRSVRQDFPLVMAMAAERVGLPLPHHCRQNR